MSPEVVSRLSEEQAFEDGELIREAFGRLLDAGVSREAIAGCVGRQWESEFAALLADFLRAAAFNAYVAAESRPSLADAQREYDRIPGCY